ncbi:LOW QUALITY PROTEIN: beta-hexosaminidase subunit alpha [Lepeophtheirus salmonis]|uniref:LOW QUALITY PROTEIN: beta-hexosaminidase subunit alpha n=1 Tax=Lepeophtheirus salmonis TaxID=72036 RepID=UPI001AE860AF|nr:LOW QUALITY PROTEIN: beta-hexosaminidase subunit alpha-like [Lepeophtheirus salmonis]
MLRTLILFLFVIIHYSHCLQTRPGPWVKPSKGRIWPEPQIQDFYDTFYSLHKEKFKIQLEPSASKCNILSGVSDRFIKRIFPNLIKLRTSPLNSYALQNDYLGELTTLGLRLIGNHCEDLPYLHMDESYELKINTNDKPGKALITSASVWGLLHGLESFSHLVYINDTLQNFVVKSTYVRDFPRFSYRGILIDSSRHFLSKNLILDTLDLMEMNKFNVLHWHITDDPSFPFVSQKFPELSKKGAYDPKTHVYSPKDVQEIIEYGRLRGIRILPEFDTPGHTLSWGLGVPNLLTPCYSGSQPTGLYGPINPILNSTYEFLDEFFEEVSKVFKDDYIHLGGDEVSFDCWKSNPSIKAFMKKHKMRDYARLESYYIQKLLRIVKSKQRKYIVWNEVFDNKNNVTKDTLIHIWVGNYTSKVNEVTKAGLQVIMSEGWYLNYISYGSDWNNQYKIDPQRFNGTEAQKRLVVGGEACMWGEFVNNRNLSPRLWPRASSIGERLWSSVLVNDTKKASPRIQEMQCRLIQRGYDVEPIIGPGFCPYTYD